MFGTRTPTSKSPRGCLPALKEVVFVLGSGFTPRRAVVNRVWEFPTSCSFPADDCPRIDYMNGFRCKVTNSVSNVDLAPAKLPRRCGADPERGVMEATPGNCTYGAKLPFYWFQKERNNVRVPALLQRLSMWLMSISIRIDVRRNLLSSLLLGPL